jgi:sigma-E factor negative regulatory protein RseC
MIKEDAIVVACDKDKAEIEIIRTKPCGLCGQTQGCGIGLWGKIFSHKKNNIFLANHINAKEGDKVILSIEESYLLMTSLLLYGIPLISMFLGMVLLSFLSISLKDLYALFGGIAGFIFGMFIVKLITKQQHDRLFKEAVMSKVN